MRAGQVASRDGLGTRSLSVSWPQYDLTVDVTAERSALVWCIFQVAERSGSLSPPGQICTAMHATNYARDGCIERAENEGQMTVTTDQHFNRRWGLTNEMANHMCDSRQNCPSDESWKPPLFESFSSRFVW